MADAGYWRSYRLDSRGCRASFAIHPLFPLACLQRKSVIIASRLPDPRRIMHAVRRPRGGAQGARRGFGQEGVGRRDVAVSKDQRQANAVLSGRALEIAERFRVQEVALSLSFTGDLAVANAMAITDEARPKPKPERLSEHERIAQSFKEAQAVLDELERVQDPELVEIAEGSRRREGDVA